MTKQKTQHAANGSTTNRGTVKGHHPDPGNDVTEGGPARPPSEGPGSPKGSASKAEAEGAEPGDDTSTATQGKQEKEHAASRGEAKTQDGRGHRKHAD